MRLIEVEGLKPGMIVSKPVYNSENICLVSSDVQLCEIVINRLKALKCGKIWVNDESDYITDFLSYDLKLKAVNVIKSIFTDYETKNNTESEKINEFKNVVENFVDELIKNRQCVIQLCNLRDLNFSIYEHSVDVARVCVSIGINMNLTKIQLVNLCESAMLHDIGKVQILSNIHKKSSLFTKEDILQNKKHPLLGYLMVKNMKAFSYKVYIPIIQHHELYNGKGYPFGINGNKINLFARIIRIGDLYSNLCSGTTNTRLYFKSNVLEFFSEGSSSQFDPEILKVFLSFVPVYDIGRIVKLSTGEKAIVVKNNPNALARPIVRVIIEDKIIGKEINLYANLNIGII